MEQKISRVIKRNVEEVSFDVNKILNAIRAANNEIEPIHKLNEYQISAVGKVVEATNLAKAKAPELALDGEFQFDAAIAPEVGELKAPGSAVAGHANTFIFPNINAGNIGYKIAARMGGWKAIGPVCQGFAKPLNDLSRGCNVDEIVDTVAVTALQA